MLVFSNFFICHNVSKVVCCRCINTRLEKDNYMVNAITNKLTLSHKIKQFSSRQFWKHLKYKKKIWKISMNESVTIDQSWNICLLWAISFSFSTMISNRLLHGHPNVSTSEKRLINMVFATTKLTLSLIQMLSESYAADGFLKI